MTPDEATKLLKRAGYRVSPTARGDRWNVRKPGSEVTSPYDAASLCRLAVNITYLARQPLPSVDVETEDYGREGPTLGVVRLQRLAGGAIETVVDAGPRVREGGRTSYGGGAGKAGRR